MSKEEAITRKSFDRFVENDATIEANVMTVETDYEEVVKMLRFAENLFPHEIIMLCSSTHKTFRYVSENAQDILGYTPSLFNNRYADDYFSLIHPDDVHAVGACYDHMIRSTQGISIDKLLQLRFIVHYRIQHAQGHFVYIEDEKVISVSSTGKHIGFTMIHSDTSLNNFAGVKLDILKLVGKKLIRTGEYRPDQKSNLITQREADVIRLIREGFRNNEIADRLSISVSTVKNHRKNIFRKLNVRNSVELLNTVGSPQEVFEPNP